MNQNSLQLATECFNHIGFRKKLQKQGTFLSNIFFSIWIFQVLSVISVSLIKKKAIELIEKFQMCKTSNRWNIL